jgi:hypothetical protein
MPSEGCTCSQFLYVQAARLRNWAKTSRHASPEQRADAVYIARIYEQTTRLLDPDAVFEAHDIAPPFAVPNVQPWNNEVGNDDPTPVDFPRGGVK